MPYRIDIDIALFGAFLALNLIVGLVYSSRAKTLWEYSVGRKDFSTIAITSTIVATWMGGGFLFYTLEKTYSTGLYFVISIAGGSIGLLLSGQLAVRMGEFLNNISVAEAMGDIYGKTVQMITATSGIIAKIGAVTIQFKVISKMLSILFNFESTVATFVAAIIVIVYSTLGGIRAITFTDVLQFFTFGTIIPILALAIWNKLQDSTQVIATLANNPMFDIKEVVGFTPQFMSTLGLLLYFAIPGVYAPELFQRIAMVNNVTQAKTSLTYAAGITLLICLLVAWVGILLLTDRPNLAPSQVVPYLVDNYTYSGFRGLLCVCITALAMSTADSCLNTSSVLFANDIVKPLTGQAESSIITARAFSLVIGLAALLLALYSNDLLSILLLSGSFYMPIFTVPMLMAVLGFRSTKRAVLIGMAAGFLTVVLWSIFLDNADSIVPGMLANLIGLVGSHYLLREKGGWLQTDPNSPLALEREARREAWSRRIEAIRNFKLYSYLQQNLPRQEYFYFLFGLYTIAATYASFYTIGEEATATYEPIYQGIYHTVLIATTSFLTFPIWPPRVKSQRFIAFFWPLGICAILFFAGTLLVIMSHFHIMQAMILMINLVMTVLLLRWPLALILAFIGVVLAVLFFKRYTGLATLPGDLGSLQFRVIYGLLLFSSFLIALFKHKQAKAKLEDKNVSLLTTNQETISELLEAAEDKARFVKVLQKSGIEDLLGVAQLSKKLLEKSKQLDSVGSIAGIIKQLHERISPIALHLDRISHRAVSYLRLEVDTIAIDALLQAVREKLRTKELAKRIRWKKMTQHKEVECDVARMESLLVNSVSFMRTVAGEDQTILIGLEDTQLGYPMNSVKPDYTKQVAALRITLTTARMLPELEKLYMAQMSEDTFPMPETTTDLPLVANERILKAHYGYTSTMANGKVFTQLYVIPLQLREVRPKDMDLPELELGAELTRSDDTYPGAQEQEAAFLKAVQERTQADLKLIREAIELIKKYHGPVRRKSGEPFYLHPLAVAHIVLDYNQDEATVLGALLHDTVEDTSLTLEQVELLFNRAVRNIVDGVTHLDSQKSTFYKVQLSSHENIRKLLEVEDQRVLYVKLADRMHNMRTIQYKPYVSQRRTSEETLLFFVPLAEHLGLKEAAGGLKELCFEVLNRSA